MEVAPDEVDDTCTARWAGPTRAGLDLAAAGPDPVLAHQPGDPVPPDPAVLGPQLAVHPRGAVEGEVVVDRP